MKKKKLKKKNSISKEGAGWGSLPHGWTKKSLESFWNSIGGSVTKCIEKVEGHVDDPGAFCASCKDRVTGKTTWRGKK